jgi:hypothetical protein
MGVEGRLAVLADGVELAGRLFGAAGHRRVADWVDLHQTGSGVAQLRREPRGREIARVDAGSSIGGAGNRCAVVLTQGKWQAEG